MRFKNGTDWDEIWMNLALSIADKKSKSPTIKVGCVIVDQNNESVLSFRL